MQTRLHSEETAALSSRTGAKPPRADSALWRPLLWPSRSDAKVGWGKSRNSIQHLLPGLNWVTISETQMPGLDCERRLEWQCGR